MDQLPDYSDERLLLGCIYCDDEAETREHVPSRVFLDKPFPENLPVVGACKRCNNGFSMDEECFACLIESVIAGSANPALIRRPKIAAILERSPALQARIEASKFSDADRIIFRPEEERIRRVLRKLAIGHAGYELKQECSNKPSSIWWSPIELLSDQFLEEFNSFHLTHTIGEIGSRGMQRLRVTEIKLVGPNGGKRDLNMFINDWVDVQDGLYRYQAIDEGNLLRIKIVIAEFLASEVVWEL